MHEDRERGALNTLQCAMHKADRQDEDPTKDILFRRDAEARRTDQRPSETSTSASADAERVTVRR